MIISVRDSQNSTLDAAALTALLAGMTAIIKSKKTLAIQLTNATENSVVNVLAGQALRDNSIKEMYSFTDEGLDSLLLRSETVELNKEHYDECVTPLLEKENMLDVLKPTKKIEFKEIFSIELLQNILTNTKNVYDYVYVMLPNDDKDIISEVTALTDEDLILIPQGKKVPVNTDNKKTYLVIKDFEPTSKFDESSMKKKYGVKKLYYIMHNVSYKDALISENLLDFLLVNKKTIKEDDNYSFTASVRALIDRYVLDKDDDEEEEELSSTKEKDILTAEEMDIIPESAIQEVTVRKGLFGKKKKIMVNM